MGDWDDQENEAIVAKKITTVYDDDIEDAIPDSWDAVEPAKVQPKAAPVKISLEERIRQKEEKRRKEREEKMKQKTEEEEFSQPMTELQREKMAEEAEIGLMRETFGLEAAVTSTKTGSIDNLNPRTKEDFNKLNELLREKLLTLEKSPHYSPFIQQLIQDVITEVDVETLKSINKSVFALATAKKKVAQGDVKKKSKGKLVVERDNDYNFDTPVAEPDDYDDFI